MSAELKGKALVAHREKRSARWGGDDAPKPKKKAKKKKAAK